MKCGPLSSEEEAGAAHNGFKEKPSEHSAGPGARHTLHSGLNPAPPPRAR